MYVHTYAQYCDADVEVDVDADADADADADFSPTSDGGRASVPKKVCH